MNIEKIMSSLEAKHPGESEYPGFWMDYKRRTKET